MKKTDLDFKDTHDSNGIPICCMTCAKWSFSGGKTCGVDDYTIPCPKWKISKYYATSKEVNNEPILSKADG
ncbi:hypothetical protein J6V85_04145 [Candidatus Saccharibacteria bacterium]|nr:hypothetical protein [Candidatus Saccharibacteria bacterium]